MPANSRSETIGASYTWSVIYATLTIVFLAFMKDMGRRGVHEYVFFAVVFAPMVWLAALAPFLVTQWIATKLAVQSVWYFLCCGITTALLILALMLTAPLEAASAYNDEGRLLEPPPFFDLFADLAPYWALVGTIGGFVYWWRAGRFLGSERA